MIHTLRSKFEFRFFRLNVQGSGLEVVFVTIVFLGILQDYIQAHLNDSSFYLSESLLYKIHWILFLPVAGVLKFRHLLSVRGKLASFLFIGILCTFFTLLHLAFASLLIHLFSFFFFDHTYALWKGFGFYLSQDFYLIFLAYLLLLLTDFLFPVKDRQETVTPDSRYQFLQIQHKNRTLQVPILEISCICAERPYLSIYAGENHYLYSSTLRDLEENLDHNVFVRVHRSTIINLVHIHSLESRKNGDYDVRLNNGLKVRLSRHYLSRFRSAWKKLTSTQLSNPSA